MCLSNHSFGANGGKSFRALVHSDFVQDLTPFDAVVLTGGGGRRLGGLDKAGLIFRGERLLDRVIRAVRGAGRVVVVGPPRPTLQPVEWIREQPEGGGPAAAVQAGLELVEAPFVVALAVDLPLVDESFLYRLVGAANEEEAAVAVDDEGRAQPLLACYPTGPLRRALARGDTSGLSMMTLLGRLAYRTVFDEGRSRDCDTLSDIEELGIDRDGGDRA